MISPKNYCDAVQALLGGIFPGEKVYRDLVPEKFERPSHEIECESFTAEQAGGGALDVAVKLTVRTFVQVDDYHHSHFDALYRRSMAILGLFAKGWLTVTDPDTRERRAPKVSALGVPVTGKDFAEVRLTVSMQVGASELAEPGSVPEPSLEMMEHAHIHTAVTPFPAK